MKRSTTKIFEILPNLKISGEPSGRGVSRSPLRAQQEQAVGRRDGVQESEEDGRTRIVWFVIFSHSSCYIFDNFAQKTA